jgi:hypothetical protein
MYRAENGTYIHLWDQLQNQNEPSLLCTETYRLKLPYSPVSLEQTAIVAQRAINQYIPVMLITGLILSQSGLVFMVAYKSNLETFAAFKRIRDAGPSNKKASRFNTGEVFQCPEFGNEGILVFFTDIWAEFEEDCIHISKNISITVTIPELLTDQYEPGSLPHGLWMVNVFDGGNITQGA